MFSLRVFRLGLLRARGLVAKCCAVPVWKSSFVLILGRWHHIGPVIGATLGCLGGPRGLLKRARGLARDNPDDPNRVFGKPGQEDRHLARVDATGDATPHTTRKWQPPR